MSLSFERLESHNRSLRGDPRRVRRMFLRQAVFLRRARKTMLDQLEIPAAAHRQMLLSLINKRHAHRAAQRLRNGRVRRLS